MVQKEYSKNLPAILDQKERVKIAKKILKVLKIHSGKTENLNMLDVGCSSGIITNFLSNHFSKTIGVDVDLEAVSSARQNYNNKRLNFEIIQSEKLPFKNNFFDVVVCNQVYNFVDNPQKLTNEIYRVLKPGGICYFSTRNKLSLIEPQYKLPFLSLMPYRIGRLYVRILGRGNDYYGSKYMTYFELNNMVKKFSVHDYTQKILLKPKEYGFENIPNLGIFKAVVVKMFLPFIPNYIFILEKPLKRSHK